MATHSIILAWRILCKEEPGGLRQDWAIKQQQLTYGDLKGQYNLHKKQKQLRVTLQYNRKDGPNLTLRQLKLSTYKLSRLEYHILSLP